MYEVYDQDLRLLATAGTKEEAVEEAECLVGPMVELGEGTDGKVKFGMFLINNEEREEQDENDD